MTQSKPQLNFSKYEVGAGIPVTDMKRARAFYEGILGLEPGDVSSDQGVSYRCGGNTALHVYPSSGAGKATHTQAGWDVDGIDGVVDALIAQGITFEQYNQPPIVTDARGIAHFPDGKVAYFKDPDGNIMSLNQV
jgi:catechol 2,3-dioxygenase-like lactoylglutathione lyase family enzyme